MPPPPRGLDPIPALRAFLDLPLKIELSSELANALGALEARAREASACGWGELYRDALAVLEQAAQHLDGRLVQLQQDRLALGDPLALRQRGPTAIKKEIERARVTVRQATAQIASEWQPRLKRQVDYVLEESAKRLDGLVMEERATPGGQDVLIQPAWLGAFQTFERGVFEEWVRSAGEGIAEAARKELDPAERALVTACPLAPRPRLSPALAAPRAEEPRFVVEPRTFEAPGFGMALMHSVRGNVMSVSMFGGVVVVLATLAERGGSTQGTSMYRNYLIAAALPVSIVFGYFGVRRDRQRMRKKNLEQRRAEVVQALKLDCQKLAERQRDALERLLVKRLGEEAARLLEAWITEHGEPALQQAEQEGAKEASTLALRLDRLQEEAGLVRGQKTQLTQQVAVDLRRRLRELAGTASQPSSGQAPGGGSAG